MKSNLFIKFFVFLWAIVGCLAFGQSNPPGLSATQLAQQPIYSYTNDNLNAFLAAIGVTPLTTVVSSITPNTGIPSSANYAWGFTRSTNNGAFNGFSLPLEAGTSTLPTTFRFVVKETNDSGAILADSGQVPAAGISNLTFTTFTFNLPATVNTSASLWFEIFSDQTFKFQYASSDVYGVYPTFRTTSGNQVYATTPVTNATSVSLGDPGGSLLLTSATAAQNSSFLTYALGFPYESGTFNAMGSSIGVRSQFNTLTGCLVWWDVSVAAPTTVTVVVKDTNSTGTVLGTASSSVFFPLVALGTPVTFTVTFPDGINDGNPLWGEYYANSHVGYWGAPAPGPLSTPQFRYSQGTTIPNPLTLTSQGGTPPNSFNLWCFTQNVNLLAARSGSNTQTASLIQSLVTSLWAPINLMPRNLYGVSGQEQTIFWDSMTGYPMGHESLAPQPYTYVPTATKGQQFSDRWVYTPVNGDVGTSTLTVNPFFAGIQAGGTSTVPWASTTLNFQQFSYTGSGPHNILGIGDSTMGGGSGQYGMAEEARLFAVDTNLVFTQVGTNSQNGQPSAGTSGIDSTGTTRNTYCEGWPGMTAQFFLANYQSPFCLHTTPTPGASSTSTTGGTLTDATTYYYRVAALSAAGTTLACTEFSKATGTGGNTNTITINWTAAGIINPTAITGYKVYGRSMGAELLVATLGNVLAWTDNGSVTPSGALPASETAGLSSVAQYLTVNSITMGSGDIINWDLGTNDVSGATTDVICQTDIASWMSATDSFIAAWQAAVSGIRFDISLPCAWAGQDGFGFINTVPTSAARWRRNRDLLIQAALAHYDTAAQNTNKVWIEPSYLTTDPVNDYYIVGVPQGQYNPTLRYIQGNTVHMRDCGFWRRYANKYAFLKVQG